VVPVRSMAQRTLGCGASPATPPNRSAVSKTVRSPPVELRNSAARTDPKPGMLSTAGVCRCSVTFSLISASSSASSSFRVMISCARAAGGGGQSYDAVTT
jgi:hypothetical protein